MFEILSSEHLFLVSRGRTRKIRSSDAGCRTQETHVKSTGLSESPHKLGEDRVLSANLSGKQWFLLMPVSIFSSLEIGRLVN